MLLITLILIGCSKAADYEHKQMYTVIMPVVTDTTYEREYVAEITAVRKVEIRSRINGFIERIYVDEGDTVKQGQLLFSINNSLVNSELQKAQAANRSVLAELKSAEIELENGRKLAAKNIISSSELELMKSKLAALQAKADEYKAEISKGEYNLSFCQIRAPFNGVINRIPNKVGSLVEEGKLLTTITDDKEILAYYNVSEKDYLGYVQDSNKSKRRSVELLLANHNRYSFKGVVETIAGEIDKNTGTIAFRARFPNPLGILRHGSSAKVIVKEELKNVLLVPQKSTFEVQDNIYVYVLDDKNNVRKRKIEPIARIPHFFVLEKGISAKEKVLYEGIQYLKEGESIIPEMVDISIPGKPS
jgi:membrane fusion protein (multidrug efflux system)